MSAIHDKTERIDAKDIRGNATGRTRWVMTQPRSQAAGMIAAEKPAGPAIIIEHDPMGAPRMTKSDKWKKRDVVVRYHALKDAVRAACSAAGYRMGGVLTVRFEVPMPSSWPKKKREQLRGQPHQQKPDVDNMGKAIADSFNEDDSHVHTMILSKVWADTGRIIITP